ncbi:MAG: hypothetical protein JXX28_09370 [Deltaproteobacteria bacterium]|nr:hypothetical protein [Deltaproteobacteria bacterium]
MRWMIAPVVWASLSGCAELAPGPLVGEDVVTDPPALRCVQVRCDPGRERWSIEVSASAWTGGGALLWTVDGQWIEEHPLRSVAAAADGSSDLLALELDQVGDWRAFQTGATTAMSCDDAVGWWVYLYDRDGQIATCASGGSAGVWDRVDGLPDCPSISRALCRPG